MQEARHLAGAVIAMGWSWRSCISGACFSSRRWPPSSSPSFWSRSSACSCASAFPRSLASFVVCTHGPAVPYLIGMGAYTQLSGDLSTICRSMRSDRRDRRHVQQRVEAMEEKTYQLLVPPRQRQQQEQDACAATAAAAAQEEPQAERRRSRAAPRPRPSPKCGFTKKARRSAIMSTSG